MRSTPVLRAICKRISNDSRSSVVDGALNGRSDPFVVELGSNDGIMLRHFKNRGMRHLGVEPSVNVADVARKGGIRTISAFFSLSSRTISSPSTATPMPFWPPM